MACQACGVEAPTRYVEFHQNIGALAMRFSKTARGELCKSCIHSYFWKFTGVNMTLGWWGMISLIVTPIFQINNTVRYLGCLGMEPVPPGAGNSMLTSDAMAKLNPYGDALLERLRQGENFEMIASDISHRAGVTPAQVALFIRALISTRQGQR